MSDVELRGVDKSFSDGKGGQTAVLHGVSIQAISGKFVVLLGPSGCGKSTSLRILAGLEQASAGDVLIDGQRVNDIPASKRHIAMVFQNYALYPHLSVMENIIFGLRVRRIGKAERERRGREAASKVGLENFLDRRPSQLSGGQRQRAALARALVSDAKVVLMDEPLSNLDAKLRHQMRVELRALQRDLGLTVVYVTHDQVEAMTMADHVIVMREGRVAQAASPVDLYTNPADVEVAAFIGSPPMNLLSAQHTDAGLSVMGAEGPWRIDTPLSGLAKDVIIGIRPESLHLGAGSSLTLRGLVRTSEILGAETLLTIDAKDESTFVARLPGIVRIEPQQDVTLSMSESDLRFFDSGTGMALDQPSNVQFSA